MAQVTESRMGKNVHQCLVTSLSMLWAVSHEARRCLIRLWQGSKLPCDKSFIHLLPESCSSKSVMFWVRFTADISTCSVQDHLALVDTSCDSSSSKGRGNEVAVLQISAWWSQEQPSTVIGCAGTGQNGPTASWIPEGGLISLCTWASPRY